MKSFKKVQDDRIKYHKNPNKFSVHRSSLLVSVIAGCDSIISFLNHFYLKRKNQSVSIKISAYNRNGEVSDTYFEEISDPKVYKYNLTNLFDDSDIQSFQVEFFSSKNLFIPFPAVIIEHDSKFHKNIVHSYNRVLNDVTEDKKINSSKDLVESSFEVIKRKDSASGFIFQSGQYEVNEYIDLEINHKKIKKTYKIKIKIPPFTSKFVSLKKYIPLSNIYHTCFIKQPKQHMFFGRLMVGIFSNDKDYFSANHSYYDSSSTKEYLGNNESFRQYPFFHNYKNTINFYPINSKSNINIMIRINGRLFDCGAIKSPGKGLLSIDINKIASENNIKFNTYEVVAKTDLKIPSRTNHQLLISYKNSNIPTSINYSLHNKSFFNPKLKKYFIWGPIYFNKNYISFLKILGPSSDIDSKGILKIYGENGIVKTNKINIKKGEVFTLSNDSLSIKKINHNDNFWYTYESSEYQMQALTLITNTKTKVTSGEHNF